LVAIWQYLTHTLNLAFFEQIVIPALGQAGCSVIVHPTLCFKKMNTAYDQFQLIVGSSVQPRDSGSAPYQSLGSTLVVSMPALTSTATKVWSVQLSR